MNEKGTEAAAATAIVVAVPCSTGARGGPTQFIADHPFLYFIRDRRTGTILFVGRVVEPAEKEA